MEDDFERSRNRWLDEEDLRRELTGHGTTRQGLAIRRKYRSQLEERLAADTRHPRNREIWGALKDADLVGTNLATRRCIDRLLTIGITAAADERVGLDKDGIKSFRDQALWLGQHLVRRKPRELEFKVGAWAIEMLSALAVFTIEDKVLTLPLTPELDKWLNEVVRQGFQSSPFLFPTPDRPEPWTQVSKGGLAASADWARVSLISGGHPASENAVRDAIARGKMQSILDAVNYLAGIPFAINKPVLGFMRRREEPRIKKLSADIAALARDGELRKLKWPERQKLANLKAGLRVWELDMAVAKMVACWDRFLVPLQIDFRGRINPLPFFNFTRQDPIRALFLFADGAPIGNDGLLYLKGHVAACAGGNKWSTVERPGNLDLAGRVGWTNDNLELLRKVGNAVLHGEDDPAKLDWILQDISDPYQFLAACVELTRALDEGPGFETHLPIPTFASRIAGSVRGECPCREAVRLIEENK